MKEEKLKRYYIADDVDDIVPDWVIELYLFMKVYHDFVARSQRNREDIMASTFNHIEHYLARKHQVSGKTQTYKELSEKMGSSPDVIRSRYERVERISRQIGLGNWSDNKVTVADFDHARNKKIKFEYDMAKKWGEVGWRSIEAIEWDKSKRERLERPVTVKRCKRKSIKEKIKLLEQRLKEAKARKRELYAQL